MKINELIYGYFFALIFCISVAFSSIFIHKTNQIIDPFLSVFLTFLICTIWFNVANISTIKVLYTKLATGRKLLTIVNFSTAINWIATFEALKFISPILYISLFMGLIPIVTYSISWLQHKSSFELKIALTLLLIAITLITITIVDKTNNSGNFDLGVIFTVISSIAGAFYMLYSKELSLKLNLTASQVVATRFYLLLFFSGIISIYSHSYLEVAKIHYINFIYLALISSIIPLYCLQKSISNIGAIKVSFIIPVTPILTYLFLIFSHSPLSKSLFSLLIIILCLILIYNAKLALRNKAL